MDTRRVAIVGAGAAGLSAAYALSKHPDKSIVAIFEKESVTGGMASSLNIDPKFCGASYINDGVQGCSPTFANTLRIFCELGYILQKVDMQLLPDSVPQVFTVYLDSISFGKGGHFWTNVFPSSLIERFAADVRIFGRVLNTVKRLEIFEGFWGEDGVPSRSALLWHWELDAVVASVILERVFKDPSMRLFEYDDRGLLANIPEMYAFQKLSDTYAAWQHKFEEPGNVNFLRGHVVTRVVSRTKQRTVVEFLTPSSNGSQIAEIDSLILATDANNALAILGKEESWMERYVLGGVQYLHDLIVTHTDVDYMRNVPSYFDTTLTKQYYETEFKPELIASSAIPADRQRGETDFCPPYYTYQYPSALKKLEMSYDFTAYQPQFSASAGLSRVYQTIFLDEDWSGDLWTKGEIKRELVVGEKWWTQQSHRWQHYARVVPWMWAINGTRST